MTANRPDLAQFRAETLRRYPFRLDYTRRGGPGSGVGLNVGCVNATSRDHAEKVQRRMEAEDAQRGHQTTYAIVEREESR